MGGWTAYSLHKPSGMPVLRFVISNDGVAETLIFCNAILR